MTSTNTRKPVKSEVRRRREAEGWTFRTNIPNLDCSRMPEPGEEDYWEYLRHLKKIYAEVEEERAYDLDGNSLPTHVAIYTRRKKRRGY